MKITYEEYKDFHQSPFRIVVIKRFYCSSGHT